MIRSGPCTAVVGVVIIYRLNARGGCVCGCAVAGPRSGASLPSASSMCNSSFGFSWTCFGAPVRTCCKSCAMGTTERVQKRWPSCRYWFTGGGCCALTVFVADPRVCCVSFRGPLLQKTMASLGRRQKLTERIAEMEVQVAVCKIELGRVQRDNEQSNGGHRAEVILKRSQLNGLERELNEVYFSWCAG